MFLLHWVSGVLKRLLLLLWDAAFVVCDHGFDSFIQSPQLVLNSDVEVVFEDPN